MAKQAYEERNNNKNFDVECMSKDIKFGSLSTAAQFIAGHSINGLVA